MGKRLAALLLGSMIATATQAGSLVGDSIDAGVYFTIDTGYGVGRILGYGLDGPFTSSLGSHSPSRSPRTTASSDGTLATDFAPSGRTCHVLISSASPRGPRR
jgi:hypothetical protein